MSQKVKRGTKCKLEVKYIEDDKRRADALYKRRRGLMKKAHELSVMCGLKISIIATDFEKICFSFCNDPRLSLNMQKVFKGVNKPLWMTDFNDLQYPFASVRGENKKKIVYGKIFPGPLELIESFNNTHKDTNTNHNLLSKRVEPEQEAGANPVSADLTIKKLKKEESEILDNKSERNEETQILDRSIFLSFKKDLFV